MKVLVTGGGGFLGTYICKELLKQNYEVMNFSRNSYIHLEEMGIQTIKGDISNYEDVKSALENIDGIFHVAALAGVWGNKNKFYKINTLGTQNIVKAAKELGIKNFVYTSTPSVVFELDDIENGDESLAYPAHYLTSYAYTKSLAEKHVLSNCDDNFHAVSIRPHLIWGPGDPHIIPRLIEKARAGKLKQVGDGNNLVDVIYVENAAIAHVLAFNKLVENKNISGRAYFIGQERPVNLWQFINQILHYAKVDLIEDSISFKKAYFIGHALEIIFKIAGVEKPEPPITRFVACQLAKSHYFSHQRAQEDFGFSPKVSIEKGLINTFRDKNEKNQLFKKVSSMDEINSGKTDL